MRIADTIALAAILASLAATAEAKFVYRHVLNGTTATAATTTEPTPEPAPTPSPTLDLPSAVSGLKGGVLPMGVSASHIDILTISGMPANATLSVGENRGGGVWAVMPWELPDLGIRSMLASNFTLTVQADGQGGSVSRSIGVQFTEPAPSLNYGDRMGKVNTYISLGLSASGATGFTVSGVPAFAGLSSGTDNGDGTWTIPVSALGTLKLKSVQVGNFLISYKASNASGDAYGSAWIQIVP